MEDAMAEARLQEVETYVSRRQIRVAPFIANNTIMDLCMAAEMRPGSRADKRWCEQDGLEL